MSLPRHLFSPSFRHQHLGRSFATIVCIMVFIATFATAAEAVLLTMGFTWGQNVESRLTVEIPAVGDEAATPQAERVRQASAILHGMPGVGLVMPLSDDEVQRLLRPWFSQPELLKALPLPTLIDVERLPGSPVTAEQIGDALKNVVSDARVDDHGAWVKDIWRLIDGLSILGGLTIALTGITLIIAVSLICRAVMAAEHETISLLHSLGAEDEDIARHFQAQARYISRRAAAVGFAAALAATAALVIATRHSADLDVLGPARWAALACVATAVPVFATQLASLTARGAVMRLIRSFP
jgi:cell division transport system permease protein